MGYTDHHDLIIYQKAKMLTKQIISISEKLPITRVNDILLKQVVRSGSSIGANIVEGYGRNNPKEYKQFLGIARGSSLETEYWLEILAESSHNDFSVIVALNKELIKMLTVTIRNIST